MSFALDVKKHICEIPLPHMPEVKAELYGFLLFAQSKKNSSRFFLKTFSPDVSSRCTGLLRSAAGVIPYVAVKENKNHIPIYHLSVSNQQDLERIFSLYGRTPGEPSKTIEFRNIPTSKTKAAFLRGAFLASGSVTEPHKEYHLEFVISDPGLAAEACTLFHEFSLTPKQTFRKGASVIYFKNSEEIEDILTLIGATSSALALMNVKVYKNLRNKINRLTNCETANISKTVAASSLQTEAIRELKNRGVYRRLSPELRKIAAIRLQHPELSLREIGGLLDPPLSRSGVNHRLNKLVSLRNELAKNPTGYLTKEEKRNI